MPDPINNVQKQSSGLTRPSEDQLNAFYNELNSQQQTFNLGETITARGYDTLNSYDSGIEKGLDQNTLRSGNMDWKKTRALARLPRDIFAEVLNTTGALSALVNSSDKDRFGNIQNLDPLSKTLLDWGEYYKSNEGRNVELYTPDPDKLGVFDPLNDDWAAWAITNLAPTFGMMVASMGAGGVAKSALSYTTKGVAKKLAKKSLKNTIEKATRKGLLSKEAGDEVFDRLTTTTIKEQTKGLARKEAKDVGEKMVTGASSYLDDVVGMTGKKAGELTSKELRKKTSEQVLAKAALRQELDDVAGRFLKDKLKNPIVDVGTAFTSAFVSRNGESLSESRQVYEATLERLKLDEPNLSKEEAETKALEMAKRAYSGSMNLILIDFAQYFQLGKLLKGSTGLFKGGNKFMAGLRNVAFEGLSEGMEEGIQFTIAKEAENEGTIFSDESYMQTFFDSLDDKEFKQSFVQGMIGGIGFSGAGQAFGAFRNYANSKLAEKFGKAATDNIGKKMMEASEHPAAKAAVEAFDNETDPKKKEKAATAAAAKILNQELEPQLNLQLKALEKNDLYKNKGAHIKLQLEVAALYTLQEEGDTSEKINELIEQKEKLISDLERKGVKEKEDLYAFTVESIESIDNYEQLLETTKELMQNQLLIDNAKENAPTKMSGFDKKIDKLIDNTPGATKEIQLAYNNLLAVTSEIEKTGSSPALEKAKALLESKLEGTEELFNEDLSNNKNFKKLRKDYIKSLDEIVTSAQQAATEGTTKTVDTPVNTDTDYIDDNIVTKLKAVGITAESVHYIAFTRLLKNLAEKNYSDRVVNALLKKFDIDSSKTRTGIDGSKLYYNSEGVLVKTTYSTEETNQAKAIEKTMGITFDELSEQLANQIDNPTGTVADKVLQESTLEELEALYNENAQPIILEEIESRIGQNTKESTKASRLLSKLNGTEQIHKSVIDFIEKASEKSKGIFKDFIIKLFDVIGDNFEVSLVELGDMFNVNIEEGIIIIPNNSARLHNLLYALMSQLPETKQKEVLELAKKITGLDGLTIEDITDSKFIEHLDMNKLENKFLHNLMTKVLDFNSDDLLYADQKDLDKLIAKPTPKSKPKSAIKIAKGEPQAKQVEGDPTSDTDWYIPKNHPDILMIESFNHLIATIDDAKEENGYFTEGNVTVDGSTMSLKEFKKKYNFYTWKKNNGSHTLIVLDKITNVPLLHPKAKEFGIDLDYLKNTIFDLNEKFDLEIDADELKKYKKTKNPDLPVIKIKHKGTTIGILSGTAMNKPVFKSLMDMRERFLDAKLKDSKFSMQIQLGNTTQGTFVKTNSYTTLSDHANGTEELAVVNMTVSKGADGKPTGIKTGSIRLGDKVLRGNKFSDQKGNVAVVQSDSVGNKYFFFAKTKLVSAMPKIRDKIIEILEGDADTNKLKEYVKWGKTVTTKNGKDKTVDAYSGGAKVKLEYTKELSPDNLQEGMRVIMVEEIEDVLYADRKTIDTNDIIDAFDEVTPLTVKSFNIKENSVTLENGETVDFSELRTYYVDGFMEELDTHRVQVPRDNPNMKEHGDRLETDLVPGVYTTPENMYFTEVVNEALSAIDYQQTPVSNTSLDPNPIDENTVYTYASVDGIFTVEGTEKDEFSLMRLNTKTGLFTIVEVDRAFKNVQDNQAAFSDSVQYNSFNKEINRKDMIPGKAKRTDKGWEIVKKLSFKNLNETTDKYKIDNENAVLEEDQADVNADILAGIELGEKTGWGEQPEPDMGSLKEPTLFDELFKDEYEVTDEMFEDEELGLDDDVLDNLGNDTKVDTDQKENGQNYGFFTNQDDTLEDEGDTTCGL